MKSEEEKEEKNSNLSTQHFLPSNPQTQAFPHTASVDRKWSWILAEGQLWSLRKKKYMRRIRAQVRLEGVRRITDWRVMSCLLIRVLLYKWEGWKMRRQEKQNESVSLLFFVNVTWSALSQGQKTAREPIIYCLPSVAASRSPPSSHWASVPLCSCLFHHPFFSVPIFLPVLSLLCTYGYQPLRMTVQYIISLKTALESPVITIQ